MKDDETKSLVEFIFEAGLLKRVPRSGWSVLGIAQPESVADHSFRCAVIGYLLAHQEGVSVERTVLMTLFNDIHESRITDLHKMAQRYIDAEPAEDASHTEQIDPLPAMVVSMGLPLAKVVDQVKLFTQMRTSVPLNRLR